ncbi:MAG: hypothetical protein JWR15_724 [Prosthecobacter sp.]|nr:hypothetical protein [Prosthecobacter sp.]
MEFLNWLFSTDAFMPHGHCYLWEGKIMRLHIFSDALIALSYLTIPITLTYIVWKRKDVPFDWIFFCFGVFILACGATHAMEIWTLWHPTYWLSGCLKAITATASVTTAILLVKLIPRIRAIPSIGKLRLAENSVWESEERMRKMIESIKDYAILTLDADGHITSWNAGAEKITGWQEDEIIGQDFSRFYSREDNLKGRPTVDLEHAAAAGRFEAEGWRLRKDGSQFWANVIITALHDASNQVYGFSKITRDMTERKKAEEEIEKLALVARETDNAVIRTDAEGGIEWVNAAFTKMTGYSFTEVKGRKPGSFLQGAKTSPEAVKLIRKHVAEASIVETEILNYTKTGKEYWASLRIQPLFEPDGRLKGFFSINSDVTKRVNEALRQRRSQRLESIGTLAGGVAHDLNNSIAPVLMLCDILRAQYPKESRLIDAVESSAKRGAGMVKHLLTFAKGAEGKLVLLDPSMLVREMQTLIGGSFPKSIRLVVNLEPNLPTVLGDVTQLHQVLLNLCVNARDAMPDGGTLTLGAQRVEVDGAYASTITDAIPGRYLMMRVQDTGTGIPAEVLERIFEPFFTTKEQDKGTGLGLSTVMGIAKGHGGFMQVYSSPGKGAAFSVFIPVPLEAVEPKPAADKAAKCLGNGELVLVVDDEFALRIAASTVLQRLNFKVLTAVDGCDGVMKAVKHRAELKAVITDMHMPMMDGLGFVRQIREFLPEIPVVVASGRLEDSVAAEFKTLRVINRLDKPFTESDLSQTMRQLLNLD